MYNVHYNIIVGLFKVIVLKPPRLLSDLILNYILLQSVPYHIRLSPIFNDKINP